MSLFEILRRNFWVGHTIPSVILLGLWPGKPFLFVPCCSEIHFYLLVIIDLTIAGQNIAVGDFARPRGGFPVHVDCGDVLDLRGGFGTNTTNRDRGI